MSLKKGEGLVRTAVSVQLCASVVAVPSNLCQQPPLHQLLLISSPGKGKMDETNEKEWHELSVSP